MSQGLSDMPTVRLPCDFRELRTQEFRDHADAYR